MRYGWPLLLLGLALAGCTENPTPDQHPEVFKTIGEVAVDRRSQYERLWQETALSLLRSDRPDLQSQPLGDGQFGVVLQSDGVRREVDLSPLIQRLGTQTGQSELILRQALRPQLLAFDQERLLATDLATMRERIRPMLLSQADLRRRSSESSGAAMLHANLVAPGLYWAPVVRFSAGDGAMACIPQAVIDHWGTSAAALDQIAMSNLKRDWGKGEFETLSFEPIGKVGDLKRGTSPAVVLLPEFLESVRREWGISDDLALLISSATSVRFLPASNKKLLDLLDPQWERSLEDLPDPLSRQVLLASKNGISVMAYDPPVRLHVGAPGGTGRPTSRPAFQAPDPRRNQPGRLPATRPYIVR